MGSGGIWILGVARSRLVVRRVRWWGRATLAVAPFFFVFLRFHDALFCFPACMMPYFLFYHDVLCLFLFPHIHDAFSRMFSLTEYVPTTRIRMETINGPITTHADISNNVNIL